MSQEPKKRHSSARQGKRRASIHLAVASSVICANCKLPVLPHTICSACGFYKGQKMLEVEKVIVRKNENSA